MKIIYLLLLFAFVQQNDASKKRDKGNRTLSVLKKGALPLALLYGATSHTNDDSEMEYYGATSQLWEPKFPTPTLQPPRLIFNPKLKPFRDDIFLSAKTQKIVCPKVPQRNAVELMNYVICFQHQEPEFKKYLMNIDKCEDVKSLFEKALKLGKCVLDVPKVILQGVKSRLFGTEPVNNLEMLEAHLKTLNDKCAATVPESSFEDRVKRIGDQQEAHRNKYGIVMPLVDLKNDKLEISADGLAEIETIDNLNFFNVKQAAEFFQKYKNLPTEEAYQEALRIQQKHLNFDKIESTMKCAKKMWPKSDSKAAEEALNRAQLSLQIHFGMRVVESFQKFKHLRKELTPEKAMAQTIVLPITAEIAEKPLKSDYQYLNFDKVESMMKCGEKMWQESDMVTAKEALEFTGSVIKGVYMPDPNIKELGWLGWDKEIRETASKTALQNRFEHFDVEELLKILNKVCGDKSYEEALNHSHKLSLISLEDISRAVKTSLSSQTPKTTFNETIKVLYYKEAKRQGIDTYDL